jgi:hypothetical protein
VSEDFVDPEVTVELGRVLRECVFSVFSLDESCKVTHLPSGAVGFADESKRRYTNRNIAFVRMTMTGEFRKWFYNGGKLEARTEEGVPGSPGGGEVAGQDAKQEGAEVEEGGKAEGKEGDKE